MPTLAMFASSSKEGVQLASAVEALAREFGLEARIVQPDPAAFRDAIFSATVVVLDGTLEQENLELYRAAAVVLSPFDHVLIAGRTYLPLNFVAPRVGGAPRYPGSQGNDDILPWLRVQLPEILADPGPRLEPGQFASMSKPDDASILRPIYEHSDAKRPRVRNAAFISHRGRYIEKALALGQKIRAGFHGPPRQPIVIEQGALALPTELLTEVRRWMIMGLLDDELRRSDELWIVETTDYRGSWWTAAELYAAAYVAETPAELLRIRIWNPETDTVRDDDSGEYRIALSDAHRKRMARILTHTRPDQLSPESRVAMKMLRWGFRLGFGWLIDRKLGTLMEPVQDVVKAALPEKTAEAVDISPLREKGALRRYVNDRVFSNAFWDDLYIEPQRIAQSGEYRPDPEAFINSPEREMIRIPATEAATAVARGRPARGKLGKKTVSLTLREAPPRFFWRPVRGRIPGNLIPTATYLVVDS